MANQTHCYGKGETVYFEIEFWDTDNRLARRVALAAVDEDEAIEAFRELYGHTNAVVVGARIPRHWNIEGMLYN